MGSFGYIAGGALAGGGKAVEQFAAENMAELRMQKIEELRAQHQSQMQQSGQQFEHGERELAYQRSLQAAGATRAFTEAQQSRLFGQQEKLEQEKQTGATERTRIAGQYRVQARQAGLKPLGMKKPSSEWSLKMGGGTMEQTPDGKNVFVPSYKRLVHSSGWDAVQVGDRFVEWDGSHIPQPGSVARPPAADTQKLMTGEIPWQDYVERYHQLPGGFSLKYARDFSAQQEKYNAQGGNEPPSQQGPEDVYEDEQAAREAGQPGGPGYDQSYANTGDAGPQATDTAPAQ